MSDVIYKDIPGYEGLYQAGTDGTIKALEKTIYRKNNGSYKQKEFIKKPCDNGKIGAGRGHYGHQVVSLTKEGKQKVWLVHRLILLTFVGECPAGMETRHLNSNPRDNRLENLCYGTKSENMQDAVKIGTLCFSRSKLTRKDIADICRATGSIAEIAKRFNISNCTVQAIKAGKSFKGFTQDVVKTRGAPKRDFIYFTDDELKEIRDKNYSIAYLMKKYGIHEHHITYIRRGKNFVSARQGFRLFPLKSSHKKTMIVSADCVKPISETK